MKAPFGGVGLRISGGMLSELVYLPASVRPTSARPGLAQDAALQVSSYLKDASFQFDLPLLDRGTPFQKKVWNVIAAIPCGGSLSYGDVARRIRSAPRAVGQACGANWFPLVIPCHRVLAAQGLGGFAHSGDDFHLDVKRWLLAHEGVAGYTQRHA